MTRRCMIRDGTQEAKILSLLESLWPTWTPAPRLSAISLQYCRAIASLRDRGIEIENRLETVDGVRHGFYRLVRKPKPTDAISHACELLFGDSMPTRYPD